MPVNIIITTIWWHLISIEYLICISQEEDDESNGSREVKENKERKKSKFVLERTSQEKKEKSNQLCTERKRKKNIKKKASGRDVYWLHRRNESINDILYIYPRNQDVHHPAAGWLRATCGAFERFTCSADINGYRYITNRHWRRNNGSHVV